MNDLWSGLLANAAIVALFVVIWTHCEVLGKNSSALIRNLGFGLLFGLGAVVAMLMPFELQRGVFVDLRPTFIALAAFFGGPIAGLAAAAMAAGFRMYEGGIGAVAGLVGIAITFASGVITHRLVRHGPLKTSRVFVFAITVALGCFLSFFALPRALWPTVILNVGLPVASLVFLATLIAALAMSNEIKRRATLKANLVYRAVIETLPDCLNAKDVDGRFIVVNPATALLMRGANADALVGKTDFDFYPYDIAAAFRLDEESVLASGQPATIEQKVLHLDGSSGWLSTLKAPLKDATGQIIGIITHNRDITERKRLETNLEKSERRLSDALGQMADGLVKFDRNGVIEFCNDQYNAMFPKTSDIRMPGASIRDILRVGFDRGEHRRIDPEGCEAWMEHIAQSLSRKGVRQIELDDGRWIEARTKPVMDGSIVVYSDITSAKRSEKQLRDLNGQLEKLANTDGLTGLFNRRSFDRILGAELNSPGRGVTFLSLMMIDVDRFKAFNDTYGHPAGDDALRRIADCLSISLKRPSDKGARYGGEELGAILPDTASEGAIQLAEAFRANVYALNIPHIGSEKGRVTVSIGIATIRHGLHIDAGSLVRLADEALYAAKAGGRNLVRAVSSDRDAARRQSV